MPKIFGILAFVAFALVITTVGLGAIGFYDEEELSAFLAKTPWVRSVAVALGITLMVAALVSLRCPRLRSAPRPIRFRSIGRRTLGMIALVALVATGCATYAPPQPSNPAPRVIFNPPRETTARPEVRLPSADAPNPCGIPDVIVRFMREGIVEKGPKGVTNLNMPMEIEPVVNDWVRCASGKVVYGYNAPMQFAWTVKDQQIPNSVYSSDGSIGGFIASRVIRGVGSVINGFSVNGQSLGGGGYNNAYISRVTVYFRLTGINEAGQQQLAFQGEGRAQYDPNSQVHDRDWGFRRAALLALRNMH